MKGVISRVSVSLIICADGAGRALATNQSFGVLPESNNSQIDC
jgi:hypothetical protein